MQQLIRGGAFRLSYTAFNFLVGLFVAAIAGPELFGTISLLIINAAVFQIVTGLGTDAAIVWHGSSKAINRDKVFSFTMYAAILQLTLFIVAAYLFFQISDKLLLSRLESPFFGWAELLYFSGLIITEKYSSLYYSQQLQHVCNKVLSGVSFFFLIVFGMAYYMDPFKGFDPLWFFCIMVFLQGVTLALNYHLKERTSLTRISKKDFQSFVNFSFLVFVTNTIQFLAYRADYWFIDYYKQLEDVGIYAQAVRFAQLLWVLPNIAAALILPVLAAPEGWFDESRLIKLVKLGNILNLVLIAGLLFVSLLFYTYFITDYAVGIQALLMMLPGYYFFSITILLAAYFSAKRKLIFNFYGSLICFVLIITCDFIFIPMLGIEGAALSNTISYSLATLFNIFMFQRITGIPVKELFMVKVSDWKEFKQIQSGFERAK